MKRLLLAFALLACWLAIPASAQQFRTSTVDPVGNCTTDVVYNTSNGKMWGCNATGTFSQINAGGGGSGTGCTGTAPCTFSVPIAAPSVATGSSAPPITPGTGGVFGGGEGTVPSVGAAASVDLCYADSTVHAYLCSFNNSSYFPITRTICAASKALQTSAISSASLANDTLTCTGLLTTDVVMCSFNGIVTAVTGYIPSTNGMLSVYVYPTANTINITAINNTSSSITPGPVTVNCRAER